MVRGQVGGRPAVLTEIGELAGSCAQALLAGAVAPRGGRELGRAALVREAARLTAAAVGRLTAVEARAQGHTSRVCAEAQRGGGRVGDGRGPQGQDWENRPGGHAEAKLRCVSPSLGDPPTPPARVP